MNIEPVAYYRGPLPEKFGIPRQAGLAPDLRGRILFEPGFRSADAVRGLEGFGYLWLIWGFSAVQRGGSPSETAAPLPSATLIRTDSPAPPAFPLHETSAPLPSATPVRTDSPAPPASPLHETAGKTGRSASPSHEAVRTAFCATVRPPRLGGNERVGVFASRSPFRPNGLGLSSVRIESVELKTSEGPVIHVLGADLMDGTPIYDIKPYVPSADSHPDARAGFVDARPWQTLEVIFPEDVKNRFAALRFAIGADEPAVLQEILALEEILAQDPRPQYRKLPSAPEGTGGTKAADSPARIYGLAFDGLDIRFTVAGNVLTVREIAVLRPLSAEGRETF